jgi:hypothetical protein
LKIENNTTNVTKASKTITTTTTKPDTNNKAKGKQIMSSNSGWLLDRKIEDATSGYGGSFPKIFIVFQKKTLLQSQIIFWQ